MRKVLLMILMMIAALQMNAQTWDEWFKQKKTQKKYLLEQIALLQVYIDKARKGYAIVQDGLGVIHRIKKGDFNLHDEFFASFRSINPYIKKYAKVAASIALQARIVKETGNAFRAMQESTQFTVDEINYCEKVISGLLSNCLDCINELYAIITADQLELKDDERIKHIDRLYADMQNKYSFCATFNEEIGVLAMQRQSESIEVNYSKILNHIP